MVNFNNKQQKEMIYIKNGMKLLNNYLKRINNWQK